MLIKPYRWNFLNALSLISIGNIYRSNDLSAPLTRLVSGPDKCSIFGPVGGVWYTDLYEGGGCAGTVVLPLCWVL